MHHLKADTDKLRVIKNRGERVLLQIEAP